MIIIKNPELREQVFNNIRAAVTKERTGIHLSDLIYCGRKAYFRKMGLAPEPTKELCLLWLSGYAYQTYLFPLNEEVTILIDGVNCTPDILSGIEVKSTRQSMKKFDLESMTHWKRQILGYCKAINKLEYDLVVFFTAGNYSPPFPDLDCWHIRAEQEEVDANWEEVLEKATRLNLSLESGIPPEPDYEEWEGGYCECVDLCPDTSCWRRKQLKEGKHAS